MVEVLYLALSLRRDEKKDAGNDIAEKRINKTSQMYAEKRVRRENHVTSFLPTIAPMTIPSTNDRPETI